MPPFLWTASIVLNCVQTHAMFRSGAVRRCPLFAWCQIATLPVSLMMLVAWKFSYWHWYRNIYDPCETFCVAMEVLSMIGAVWGCFSEHQVGYIFSALLLHFTVKGHEYIYRFTGAYVFSLKFWEFGAQINLVITCMVIFILYAGFAPQRIRKPHEEEVRSLAR